MKLKTFLFLAAILAIPAGVIAQENADAVKDAYKAANDKMMHEMMKPMSGDADKDFVMMMMPHHQGAIDWPRWSSSTEGQGASRHG